MDAELNFELEKGTSFHLLTPSTSHLCHFVLPSIIIIISSMSIFTLKPCCPNTPMCPCLFILLLIHL